MKRINNFSVFVKKIVNWVTACVIFDLIKVVEDEYLVFNIMFIYLLINF